MEHGEWKIVKAVALILFIATYCKYVLGWSTKDFVLAILKEFRELLVLKVSLGSVNAVILLCNFVMLIAAFVAPKFDKILAIGGAVPADSLGSSAIAAVMLIQTIGGLICVSFIRGPR